MFKFLKTGYEKILGALSKTRSMLTSRLRALFQAPWDEETLERLEQILYEADLGTTCSAECVKRVGKFLRNHPGADFSEIAKVMRAYALEILKTAPKITAHAPKEGDPLVILIVGVNGSGKTTTIAKLAHQFQQENQKVLLGAGDTFRAAAIEQLTTWAERIGADIVKSKPGSDPSAVAFDAITAAKARGCNTVFIDTAGRLQNKTDLMHELEKIRRVSTKVVADAPHETLLVLDATTGQNAIDQARTFNQFTPLTGLVLTKIDGSAKGGIILAIYKELGIPVRWIGTGEGIDDLHPFNPEAYVEGLFGD